MSTPLPSFVEARDQIKKLFNDYWTARSPVYNDGQAVRVDWEEVDAKTLPPRDAPWARFTLRHSAGRQHTFGKLGERRFNRTGIVVVQVFLPQGPKLELLSLENLATIARDAFEGKSTPSGIFFRNVTIVETTPRNDGFLQFNVTADFSYDELK